MKQNLERIEQIRNALEQLAPQPSMYTKVPTARSARHAYPTEFKLILNTTDVVLPQTKIEGKKFPRDYLDYYAEWYPKSPQASIPFEVLLAKVSTELVEIKSKYLLSQFVERLESKDSTKSKWTAQMHEHFETAEAHVPMKKKITPFEGDLRAEVTEARDYIEQFNPFPESYRFNILRKCLTLAIPLKENVTIQKIRYPLDYEEDLLHWYPSKTKFSVHPQVIRQRLKEANPLCSFPPERVIAAHLRELEESRWMLMMRERYNAVKS